jgi:hypothetical protein
VSPRPKPPTKAGNETTAGSWADVEAWIADNAWARPAEGLRATLLYRGLATPRYGLESSLGRRGKSYASRERHLLRNFRKYSYRHGDGDWSEWNWLAFARHHGLPTRITDWTFSPLIALHFATLRYPKETGTLHAVDFNQVHDELPEKYQPFRREEGTIVFTTDMLAECAPTLADFDRDGRDRVLAIFFEPPSIEERIVAQSAAFCALSSATAHLQEWLGQHPEATRRLILPPEVKAEARERLDLNGITERLLFPGPGGVAAWLARYYADGSIEPGGEHPPDQD